mgnify:CR=1 FL=1
MLGMCHWTFKLKILTYVSLLAYIQYFTDNNIISDTAFNKIKVNIDTV